MDFWSRLLGDSPKLEVEPPTPGKPSSVNALRFRLVVHFHVHQLPDADGTFLTAFTQGLINQRQSELVLTLRLPEADDVAARMQQIVRFFVTVYAWARARKPVHPGGYTTFKERGLFRPDSGVLYVRARPIRGLQLPPDALAVILASAEEVRTAIEFGAYRVLMRIGELERSFPYPTWNALDRASVVGPRENETALAKVPRIRMPGVSFLLEGKRLRVQLGGGAKLAGRGLAALPQGAPFALLLEPSSAADAVFFWHPGQEQPAGLVAPGSSGLRKSGSCLAIAPGGQKDEARPFEDGYTLLFSTPTWQEVSFAIRDQRDLSIALSDGTQLEFAWLREKVNARV